jgi:hypothetical protein
MVGANAEPANGLGLYDRPQGSSTTKRDTYPGRCEPAKISWFHTLPKNLNGSLVSLKLIVEAPLSG